MKSELPIIDVEMEMSFEERSLLDLVICAIECENINSAIKIMKRLNDRRAVAQAAMAIGAYVYEKQMPYILLDLVEMVDDPKLRFGWLLECLFLGVETDLKGESVFEMANQEIVEIDDSNFAIGAMMSLDHQSHQSPPTVEDDSLSDHVDPDIASLSLIPDPAFA